MMMRLGLLCALSLTLTMEASGQSKGPWLFNGGLTAGVTAAQVRGDGIDGFNKLGFHAGAVLDIRQFQDLGFQSAEFATPALDAFAAESLVLARYYVQPVCTPTRAALLTARHPFRMGLQSVIPQAATAALPTTEATLAEALRAAGTHQATALGKWVSVDEHTCSIVCP